MSQRDQIKQAVRECDEADAAYQEIREEARKRLLEAKERVAMADAALDVLLDGDKLLRKKKPRRPIIKCRVVDEPGKSHTQSTLPDLDEAGLRRGSRPYRLGVLLQANRGRPYTGAEAAKELGFTKKEKTTLYSDFARLEEKGIAEKQGRGTWQAARLNGTEPPS